MAKSKLSYNPAFLHTVGYRDQTIEICIYNKSRFPTYSRVSRLAFFSLYILFTLICKLHKIAKEHNII